ncbi:sugar ABC transporter permease [Marispirochaeta aestuarii]|uniref:Sugar ABC transporter permease n=1 Tax=Marispirochaeta aestuarii TaxID=1963862 RepID=A0A1Y1RUC8_9SPIO|nr:carbohydrate ABC transporter permease [Marispirochaeta aestuarii]ORC30326.1 sugar ABC transporter permease [Marispirochaeta aestuarii]
MRVDIKQNKIAAYIFLSLLGLVMVYPLLWLFASSFRTNQEIFTSLGLIPGELVTDAYARGWQGSGQYSYGTFFINTFLMVIPTVLGTIVSSALVGYGFARFRFPFKKLLFILMISQLMLPNAVIIIPRYILFRSLGWLNTYLPFIVPAMFATYSFFIFMMVQFIRGIPKELDESAYIDGCNSFTIFTRIMAPLLKPALFSAGIFQFIWRWNDFLNPLIYINSVKKYPLSLALRMSMDITDAISWNQLMAMSLLTMIPPILIFFFAQRYFVEGITTTGLKG